MKDSKNNIDWHYHKATEADAATFFGIMTSLPPGLVIEASYYQSSVLVASGTFDYGERRWLLGPVPFR